MKKYFENLAKALFGIGFSELADHEQAVIESIAGQTPLASNVNEEYTDRLRLGDRIADGVARFGGSWKFIILFFAFIALWISINTYWLITGAAFDPYPFILLNLGLSTLAAFQAPIIMMSQNRQAKKDKIEQDVRYQTSLKIELEIIRLHEKLDKLNNAKGRINN